jgi:hypothetical protein
LFIFHQKYITDTQCGFRAIGPNIIKNIPIESKGFQIETEFLIKALRLGYKITEIPIHSGKSTRESHMKFLSDSFKILLKIIELRLPLQIKSKLSTFLYKIYSL